MENQPINRTLPLCCYEHQELHSLLTGGTQWDSRMWKTGRDQAAKPCAGPLWATLSIQPLPSFSLLVSHYSVVRGKTQLTLQGGLCFPSEDQEDFWLDRVIIFWMVNCTVFLKSPFTQKLWKEATWPIESRMKMLAGPLPMTPVYSYTVQQTG